MGKSTVGGHELTVEALYTYTIRHWLLDQQKRREFWIVGPEYTDSEKEFRVFWNDCKKLELPMDKPGSYNNTESGEMVVSLWGGRFLVHAKSAKYPATLVGEGLAGVIMAEAAKMKQLVWSKYIRPTLADVRGWSLWNSTPEGKNWYYDLHQQGADPNFPDWQSWRSPSWINDMIFPGGGSEDGITFLRDAAKAGLLTPEVRLASGVDNEIIDMMLEMSTERFNQEVGAMFTDFVGRVFKDFDEEVHVVDIEYNPQWPLYAACDYGWTNPFVWILIQTDPFDNVYVLDEYRCTHKDIQDIGRELLTWKDGLSKKARCFYPDPSEPGDTAILEKYLQIQSMTETGGELKLRLERIRQQLKLAPPHAAPELQRPRLWIDRKCGPGIREMLDYRYPDTKAEEMSNRRNQEQPEEPIKKDDHFPEALGRFFRGHYGAPASGDGRAKVSTARYAS
jgi:hypothetical protein